MAIPDIIELKRLKNVYRDGIFEKTVDLVVDTDTEKIIGAIHKEDFAQLLFQFSNVGANSFDFNFYGAYSENTPPDFDNTTELWTSVPNGTDTVPATDSRARRGTDNWTWILITVNRTNAGSSTTGSLYIMGK